MTGEAKTATIISVGNELLVGSFADENLKTVAQDLVKKGILPQKSMIIKNDEASIADAVRSSLNEVDVTVICGGLGPAETDITRQVIAKTLGLPLETDRELADEINRFLIKKGTGAKENDYRQAKFPKGAVVLRNKIGTAQGFYIKFQSGKILIALPGRPVELNDIIARYSCDLKNENGVIYITKRVFFMGITEAKINHVIEEMTFDESVLVRYVFVDGNNGVTIVASGDSEKKAQKRIDKVVEELYASRIGKYICGVGDDPVQLLIRLLRENKKTVATAESCTGGLIAKLITDCPGASDVFYGSVVSYANSVKMNVLDVPQTTLNEYGAVSHQTARKMAENVRRMMGTDYGISVTGIAGPGGGTDEKPVGLVYFAFSSHGDCEISKKIFEGTREQVRRQAAEYAIKTLISIITNRE